MALCSRAFTLLRHSLFSTTDGRAPRCTSSHLRPITTLCTVILPRTSRLLLRRRSIAYQATQYPSFVFPDNHFHVPLEDDEEPQFTHSLATAHGPWPSYRLPEEVERRPYHFGHQRSLSTPLLSTAARLIYFARREIIAMGIPPNLPLNRAAAGDQIIPTQEDIHEVNASTHAALPRRASSDWVHSLSDSEWHAEMRGVLDENVRAPSSRWDQDFARLHAFDPWDMPNIRGVPYRPGCMAGRWAGRMLVSNPPPTHCPLMPLKANR